MRMNPITLNLLGSGARLNLARSQRAIETAIERLATGKRINRAGDDPSGMRAVESMSAERIALEKRIERLELDGLGYAAKEGVLGVVNDLLVELDGLVVSAANTAGLDQGERRALQIQADSILDAIDHISATASFRGRLLLGGRGAGARGAGAATIEQPGDPEAKAPGPLSLASLRSGGALNLIDGDLEAAQKVVRASREGSTTQMARLGETMKDNERRQRLAGVELENITGMISQIQDTDYAQEVSALVRAQVLEQASIAVLSLGARQAAASVLGLLPR